LITLAVAVPGSRLGYAQQLFKVAMAADFLDYPKGDTHITYQY